MASIDANNGLTDPRQSIRPSRNPILRLAMPRGIEMRRRHAQESIFQVSKGNALPFPCTYPLAVDIVVDF